MADGGGNRAALQAEAGDEGAADVAVPAVTRNHRDLGEIGGRIGEAAVALGADRHLPVCGDDPP